MDEITNEYKVFIRVDENNNIFDINSSAFLTDTTDWIEIDSGTGDKYHHAQANYLDGFLYDEYGRLNYCYTNGIAQKRDEFDKNSDSFFIDQIKTNKLIEIGNACEATIFNGIDVETSHGIEHFSLTLNDQTNISVLASLIEKGATTVLYHADKELCRLFTSEEFLVLLTKATEYKVYHTTYCNHLNIWIRRCTSIDEINSITYGIALPEDLMANLNALLGLSIA